MGLIEDAEEVWEFLNRNIDIFPGRCCKIAVSEMSRRGYGTVAGNVLLDDYCRMGKEFSQFPYWNMVDVSGKYFDITASQFNIYLSKSLQMDDVNIWRIGDETIYQVIKDDVPFHMVI